MIVKVMNLLLLLGVSKGLVSKGLVSKCLVNKGLINKGNSIVNMVKKVRQEDYLYNLYKGKTENQKIYENYLEDNKTKIVIVTGPAGTGKTLLGCIRGIKGMKSGEYSKMIITRPMISVEEEELGFLPGNIVKKMDPWTRPIMDILMEYYSKSEIDNMIYSNKIEMSPLAYMRGRTFNSGIIIADEMQNSTPAQMLMLTTRIGKDSKLIITGDLKQTDRKKETNGLSDLVNKVKKYNIKKETELIKIIELDKGDIERSEIVEKIIEIYEEEEKVKNSDAALIPLKDKPRKGVL